MNAAGKDLRGCQFVGQDLTGAIFDGCSLYDVRIEDCSLKRTSYRGTVFTGAQISAGPHDLEGADFTDATINGVQFPSYGGFPPFQLSPQQLTSTRSYKTKDLHHCIINGSWERFRFDFRGADLRGARFMNGDFRDCSFVDARVSGATFENFTLTFEQLATTLDYQHRALQVRIMAGGTNAAGLTGRWDFSGINLTASYLWALQSDADFTDARLDGCTMNRNLSKEQLYSTRSYKEGYLAGVELVGIDLSGCDLSRMNLTGCLFSQCKFVGVNFEDAVITGARFFAGNRIPETERLTLDQIKSTWNYKHGRMEGIRLPNKLAEALKREEAAIASE